MPTSFLDLPRELRNKIYSQCLITLDRLYPWTYERPTTPTFTPGLLRTHKTIHQEASPIFYGQNQFEFTLTTSRDIATFLQTIGRRNANSIRHITVSFPDLRRLELGNVMMEEESLGILESIQSGCVNLSTLTTSLDSAHALVYKLDAFNHHEVMVEALKLVDFRFRAFSSPLQEIIINVVDSALSEFGRAQVEKLGWSMRDRSPDPVKELDYESDWDDFWGVDHEFSVHDLGDGGFDSDFEDHVYEVPTFEINYEDHDFDDHGLYDHSLDDLGLDGLDDHGVDDFDYDLDDDYSDSIF